MNERDRKFWAYKERIRRAEKLKRMQERRSK